MKQITGEEEIGWGMNASNMTDKKVKTKNTWLLK